VGVAPLHNLITGWLQLMQEVKEATTFAQIRDAGERYGKVIGRDAARAFAMLAMAAINQTAHGFVTKVQTLPGSAQVAMQADAQGGVWLPAVAKVREVAVTAEGFRVALPPSAVAMAARHGRDDRTEEHHIGTIANEISTARGGPWTPRLRKLYARAGMRLQDPENIVPIEGHRGPHPEQYHRTVYKRLTAAMGDCRSIEVCRAKLTRALEKLAEEIATPGSELNQLVTQGKPR
jgi:HNH/ENDO VII superfamily nuclease